jgi:hypothetical protein
MPFQQISNEKSNPFGGIGNINILRHEMSKVGRNMPNASITWLRGYWTQGMGNVGFAISVTLMNCKGQYSISMENTMK